MDLFSQLERALEGIVEGVFSRAFRAPLQPIEVAKRLVREMEDHRTVSVNATYVPNHYTVHLAPETFESFAAISGQVSAEIGQYLQELATERRYQLVGPVIVELIADADLKAGEVRISVASQPAEAVPPAPVNSPGPAILRSYPERASSETPAATSPDIDMTTALPRHPTTLEIISGEGQGTTYPLVDPFTIGRSPANSLVLNQPDVSRQHAEIVREGDAWMIRDLGSTNGTFVNDRRITEQPLRPGDVVRAGNTVIRVK